MAVLGLDAAQRKHKAARTVAPVSPERHHAHHVKRADHLARRAQPHLVAQANALECVVYQLQALLQRRADMVGEFQRGRPRAALGAVHHDEVWRQPGLLHRLGNRKPFPRVANAKLEPCRFTAGEFAQPGDELEQPNRRAEFAVAGGGDAVHPHRHPARFGNFRGDLGARQHATVAGFGPLAEFDLDHFYLRVTRIGLEPLLIETAIRIAAPKVTRANFPNQITTMRSVMGRD